MWILAFTTSTPRGSVSLLEGGVERATRIYEDDGAHAERLFSAIDDVLREAGRSRREIDAIACDVGPGSFTGIRVGVSVAKGIALGLGVPTMAVGSLQAMAAGAGPVDNGQVVVAALDAKKGEVFLAGYRGAGDVVLPPRHLPRGDVSAVIDAVDGPTILVGAVFAEIDGLAPHCRRSPLSDGPHSLMIGRMAFDLGQSLDPADLEAVYVRPPDAKTLLEQQRG